jgi:hypothetical protein
MRPFRHPGVVATALLVALFVRALVPAGFMPAQGELVELCSMHGPLMVRTDPLTGELLVAEDEELAPPCPFALILTALAASPASPPMLLQLVANLPTLHAQPGPAGRPSLALPPARAPPLALST